VRTVIHENNLSRDIVKSPLLDIFKMQLGRVVDNLTWAPFLTKDWTGKSLEVPSHLGCSVIL